MDHSDNSDNVETFVSTHQHQRPVVDMSHGRALSNLRRTGGEVRRIAATHVLTFDLTRCAMVLQIGK